MSGVVEQALSEVAALKISTNAAARARGVGASEEPLHRTGPHIECPLRTVSASEPVPVNHPGHAGLTRLQKIDNPLTLC